MHLLGESLNKYETKPYLSVRMKDERYYRNAFQTAAVELHFLFNLKLILLSLVY